MRYITLLLAAGASGKLYVGSGFEHKNIADKIKETSAYRTFCTPLWPMNPPCSRSLSFRWRRSPTKTKKPTRGEKRMRISVTSLPHDNDIGLGEYAAYGLMA